jgi:hypothetical protein
MNPICLAFVMAPNGVFTANITRKIQLPYIFPTVSVIHPESDNVAHFLEVQPVKLAKTRCYTMIAKHTIMSLSKKPFLCASHEKVAVTM